MTEMLSPGQEATLNRAVSCSECTRTAAFPAQMASGRAALAPTSLKAHDDALAAAALYRSLRPTDLPAVPGLDLAARYVTGSGSVGGDWYDVFVLPDGRLGVVVGDVAGSGLEAGVIMGRMRSALRACVLEAADPGTALSRLDRESLYFEPDAMATVLYGLYTPRTGELAISSAGHLPPVLATPGRRAGPIPVQPDPPIGTAENLHRRTTITFIPPGALLCCFTDGLVERRDESIDHGIGKLAEILGGQVPADTSHDPGDATGQLTEDACAAVVRAMTGQASTPDDIAVLMLRRRPGPRSLGFARPGPNRVA